VMWKGILEHHTRNAQKLGLRASVS
jgi:hypothetical protein